MRRLVFTGLACALLWGCESAENPAKEPTRTAAIEKASQEVHDQLKAGAFQVSLARETLAEAYQEASKLPKGLGEARDAILETLDTLGQDLGPHAEDPPEIGTSPNRMTVMSRRREAAIVQIKDSIHDLNDTRGEIAAALEAGLSGRTILETLDALIEDTIETLLTAIGAFGDTSGEEQS